APRRFFGGGGNGLRRYFHRLSSLGRLGNGRQFAFRIGSLPFNDGGGLGLAFGRHKLRFVVRRLVECAAFLIGEGARLGLVLAAVAPAAALAAPAPLGVPAILRRLAVGRLMCLAFGQLRLGGLANVVLDGLDGFGRSGLAMVATAATAPPPAALAVVLAVLVGRRSGFDGLFRFGHVDFVDL